MGYNFMDHYSLLHFAMGIVFYFWGITLKASIIIHTIFEILENTKIGMLIINKFYYWPGGKTHADNLSNSIGDTFFFIIGWTLAKFFEN
jgi:hypothetical protein